MTDKYFLAAPGSSANEAAGSRVLWTGRCAVAEYAFEEPSSLPRWTLPEETEVVVTEDRVVYRDVTTGATGELLWPFPQHLRVQPGNRDTGRSATVTQIQLVCAGSGGSFPALVFAGGDLSTVGDADRLANVLRQAIARYRVEHAGDLGIPAPQTRMLSRLVIGPEFHNYQGGEGQTVSLLGSVPVVEPQPEPHPYADEPFLQPYFPSAPASGSVPAAAVSDYAPQSGASAYAPQSGAPAYTPQPEPSAYAPPAYAQHQDQYAAGHAPQPAYAPQPGHAAQPGHVAQPGHASEPDWHQPAQRQQLAHEADEQPRSPGWPMTGRAEFGVTPPQVPRPGFDEIARSRPARPADEATLRGAPDLEARAADLAARVADLIAGGTGLDHQRTEMTNLSTVLGGPDAPADRAEQARRAAARFSGNSGRAHGVTPRRPADDELGSATRRL
ncbi:MAG TPA: translation initiation factor 2 [Actinoplanes sp.]|nr:translation initiation factor 2 [Actinoplanes sp.]